jgi:maltooligosyltrehalose synthase
MSTTKVLPRATMRLQLNKDFTFDQARAVVPYLAKLGISHVYASPILAARPGSMHSYDTVDPTRINPELGGREGLRRFSEELRRHDMGLIVDIVPNHMAATAENPW